MCIKIPEVRVGEPQVFSGVAVFPLFTEQSPHGTLDYLLSDEAMVTGTCAVSETGSVGELSIDNCGDRPVLFLEGEEVRGGKQNRVFVSSVLAAGRSKTRIPVCCVERKRWEGSSPLLKAGSCCPPSVRFLLQEEADGRQSRIWAAIRRKHRATATHSATENMSDVLDVHRKAAEGLRQGLRYPEGASGIAIAFGGKVAGIDIFDKPATLAKLWDRLMRAVVLDALELRDSKCWVSGSDVSVKLYMVRNVRWQQADSVGLGEAYRARGEDDTLATALVMDGTLIHFGMSMPM
jgi:hypothetical protein